jgi:hypothetical protein
MSARHRNAGMGADACATLQDGPYGCDVHLAKRHTENGARHDGSSAHRIDVGKSIGGGDTSKMVWCTGWIFSALLEKI